MKAVNIAMKDFEMAIRTRRFQIIVLLFILTSLGMVYSSKRLGVSASLYKTPFQMLFLSSFSNAFNYLISLSGILIGATAISTELESGTLKLILSKPVYRDKVLLGKLLGGLLVLSVTLTLFYVLTVAFALLLGVSITVSDLGGFLITLPFSILYGVVFLNIGLFVSTFIKKSKNAIILAVFIFIFFGFLLSVIGGVIGFVVAGLPPLPEIPEDATNLSEEQLQELFLEDPAYQAWLTKMTTTAEKVLYISPNYHYQEVIRILFGGKPQISEIVSALAYEESVVEDRSIRESLNLVWQNILVLTIMLLLPFSLTYAKFIKADLR